VNRLAPIPCLVIASYVAIASYIAWPVVVYEIGGSRVGLSIPNSVANRGESRKDYSPPTEQTRSALPSYGVPNPVAIPEKPAHAVSPGTNYHESIWVTVLLPARVHTGPSVDTPITHFYAVGTPLHVTRYWNDWIEVIEPGASKSGWIYRKYLGAISNSEQSKMALQEAQGQKPVAEVSAPAKRHAKATAAKRYAKAVPAKRYASTIGFSRKSSPTTSKPNRGRTEMASLLQRAFSGY
jgi:hypothetical protein